jgi:hypothetical protein
MSTVVAAFDTRRQAEIAVEHLVQEYGIDRRSVSVHPSGAANSAGTRAAGADVESGHPGVEKHGAPELNAAIEVSVDCDEADRARVERAFASAEAAHVQSR